jgi:hypothetical protein
MATTITSPHGRISIPRSAGAGAATLTLLYVLCWIGAVVGVPVTHLWIQGFTLAPVDSYQALGEGVFWSIIAGAIAGGTAAFFYNSFGRRRA